MVQNGPKRVENETYLIFEALISQQYGEPNEAIEKYENLYKKTDNSEYLKEALKLSFALSLPLESLLEAALKDLPNDNEVTRIHAGWLLRQERVEDAKAVMHNLAKKEKSAQNLTILGSIYLYQKDYNTALKYYDTIYKQESDENSLMMIVELLDTHLGKTTEAISYLETHSRLQKSSKTVYYRLIQIYGKNKQINGLTSTYRRLYEEFGEKEHANKVVELLLFQRNRIGAIKFLDKSGHNPQMLMDLYASNKEYNKAFEVAEKAYKDSSSLIFLGLMAVYQYEDAEDKNSEKLLKSVSEKFEIVVKGLENPLFLNYYGYLLIEHDKDIQKGISLVKRALKQEPDSPYYIDSLAWGYYKLNRCKEALEVISAIVETIDEPEVKEHYEKIQECIRQAK